MSSMPVPMTNQELQSYTCRACGAQPGQPCMTYGRSRKGPGSHHPTQPHQARWDAAELARARGFRPDPVVALYGPPDSTSGTFTAAGIESARQDPRGECTCTFTPVSLDTYVITDLDPHCPVHNEQPEQLAHLGEPEPFARITVRHTGLASHDGFAEHSHEVRHDHRGVARVPLAPGHWTAVSKSARKDLQVLIDAALYDIKPSTQAMTDAADRLHALLTTLAMLDEQ